MVRRLTLCSGLLAAVTALAGCANQDFETTAALTDGALPHAANPMHEGHQQFTAGHFGLAADAYALSIERDPTNAEGWLGLAASYDQIRRFDEADRAYAKAQELVGPTPSILNNLGYSYLLRGELKRSRETLAAAYHADPGNPYIVNNIELLNERLAALGKEPLAVN